MSSTDYKFVDYGVNEKMCAVTYQQQRRRNFISDSTSGEKREDFKEFLINNQDQPEDFPDFPDIPGKYFKITSYVLTNIPCQY